MFRFYSACGHSLSIVVSMEAKVASSFQLGVVREMLHSCILLSFLRKGTSEVFFVIS